MATTKSAHYNKPWSWIPSTSLGQAWYYAVDAGAYDADLDALASSGDILQTICLPADIRLAQHAVSLQMGEFDSDVTPTATFSLVFTDGTTSFEIIKDAAIGRTATTGDFATPGERAGDEIQGFQQITDSTPWEIQIKLTAALATAATASRWILLELGYYSVQ